MKRHVNPVQGQSVDVARVSSERPAGRDVGRRKVTASDV